MQHLHGVLRPPIEFTQYLTMRYPERLEKDEATASVGTKGYSYNDVLAKSLMGLYKTEVIYHEVLWAHGVLTSRSLPEWV